jgi:glycosyltransferase involved in cell wall biosynthesis
MPTPLRIAQVVCTDAFAGVERYVTTLATGLAERGCEVVVIGGEGARMGPILTAAGARWEGGTSVGEALVRLIRRRGIDVVHAHMTAAELAAVLGSVVVRAPIVATRHFPRPRGSSSAARLLGRLLTPRLAAQLAISRYVAETTEGSSIVVRPGTAEHADVPGPSGREPVVLVVQRLEVEKRTDLALEAWQRSGLAATGWRLQLAGDGQERAALEALAVRLGISGSCDFLGARSDVETLQRRASVLLAPCPVEAFGLSVVEAMAAGLPVVAAASGGHLETVGLTPDAALYAPLDVVGAGHLLAELAVDPGRRASYGATLRELHHQSFSVDRQVASTLDVYHSVLR